MRKRATAPKLLGLVPSLLLLSGQARGQPQEDLRKEIDALKQTLTAIQKDIQEIKALLQGRQAAPPALNVVLDLGDNPVKGEPTARLTLVEFSDYQCPYCGRYVRETFPRIEKEYIDTGKLRYVLLDLPLESIHKLAFRAAEAAQCAGEQGKYWEMHGELFGNQAKLEPWGARAQAIGLDIARFEECMNLGKFATAIRRDMAEAQKAGVTGTPSFVLAVPEAGGTRVRTLRQLRGAQTFASFKAQIDGLLEPSKLPPQESPK